MVNENMNRLMLETVGKEDQEGEYKFRVAILTMGEVVSNFVNFTAMSFAKFFHINI